ncbi:DNA/RNA helicase domain-containing protein [Micromonospora sp. M12]
MGHGSARLRADRLHLHRPGFEYDWSGVIIGKDLVVRDGRLVSDPRKSCDPAIVNREGRVIARNADRLIRNTYKVLLTRGLRGTLLFADDPETQAFLSQLIPAPHRPGRLIAPGVRRIDAVRADGPTGSHTGTPATLASARRPARCPPDRALPMVSLTSAERRCRIPDSVGLLSRAPENLQHHRRFCGRLDQARRYSPFFLGLISVNGAARMRPRPSRRTRFRRGAGIPRRLFK